MSDAAIPSLRARDCPAKEKEALNYLFLVVPLINVTLPLLWKSFAAVWSADVIAFFAMYAWKVHILTLEEAQIGPHVFGEGPMRTFFC